MSVAHAPTCSSTVGVVHASLPPSIRHPENFQFAWVRIIRKLEQVIGLVLFYQFHHVCRGVIICSAFVGRVLAMLQHEYAQPDAWLKATRAVLELHNQTFRRVLRVCLSLAHRSGCKCRFTHCTHPNCGQSVPHTIYIAERIWFWCSVGGRAVMHLQW